MKLIKTTGLVVAVACGLIALSPTSASAQAPTVTWQALNSTTLRVDWTPLAQASSYEVFVSGATIGTVGPIPVLTTFFVVDPVPAGTYLVAIRGRAGNTVGPLSNPVTVTMGGSVGGCVIDKPSVTASTAGSVVTVSWGAVAGAIGYRLQLGTAPGATQVSIDVSAGQTSYSAAVPVVGTYYARVHTASACGAQATSADQAFTIGSPTPGPPPPPSGTGPRTPDPAPGQLIPRATLGYANAVIAQMGAQFNADLQNSCREHGGNNAFMFRLVQRLRQIDSRWGLNDKRGQAGDMSQDILSYNPTNRPDNGESQVYLFDIIANHCGSGRADVWFNDVTDVTWAQRGNPACGTTWCARWTIDAYLRSGGTADLRQ